MDPADNRAQTHGITLDLLGQVLLLGPGTSRVLDQMGPRYQLLDTGTIFGDDSCDTAQQVSLAYKYSVIQTEINFYCCIIYFFFFFFGSVGLWAQDPTDSQAVP